MAQLPSALASAARGPARSASPLRWTAKSTMVVVPPQAAARVPVSKVSDGTGAAKGQFHVGVGVDPPGHDQAPGRVDEPRPFGEAVASCGPGAARATMRSSSTRTSAAWVPVGLTTVPPEISVRTWGSFAVLWRVSSGLDEGA